MPGSSRFIIEWVGKYFRSLVRKKTFYINPLEHVIYFSSVFIHFFIPSHPIGFFLSLCDLSPLVKSFMVVIQWHIKYVIPFNYQGTQEDDTIHIGGQCSMDQIGHHRNISDCNYGSSSRSLVIDSIGDLVIFMTVLRSSSFRNIRDQTGKKNSRKNYMKKILY